MSRPNPKFTAPVIVGGLLTTAFFALGFSLMVGWLGVAIGLFGGLLGTMALAEQAGRR